MNLTLFSSKIDKKTPSESSQIRAKIRTIISATVPQSQSHVRCCSHPESRASIRDVSNAATKENWFTFSDMVYHPPLIIFCCSIQMTPDLVPPTGLARVDANVDMASRMPTDAETDDTGGYSHDSGSPRIQVCCILLGKEPDLPRNDQCLLR